MSILVYQRQAIDNEKCRKHNTQHTPVQCTAVIHHLFLCSFPGNKQARIYKEPYSNHSQEIHDKSHEYIDRIILGQQIHAASLGYIALPHRSKESDKAQCIGHENEQYPRAFTHPEATAAPQQGPGIATHDYREQQQRVAP